MSLAGEVEEDATGDGDTCREEEGLAEERLGPGVGKDVVLLGGGRAKGGINESLSSIVAVDCVWLSCLRLGEDGRYEGETMRERRRR